jgi:hypothetical protein
VRACTPRVSQSAQSPIAAPFRFPLSSHMLRAQLTALTGPPQGSQEYPRHGAEGAYEMAVADTNNTNGPSKGSSAEFARAALRDFLGDMPVFLQGRRLAARLTMNPGALVA